jgi:hypothetical protein
VSRSVLVVSPYRVEYGPPQTLEHVCRALVDAGYDPVCAVSPGAHLTEELRALGPRVREVAGLETFPRTLNALRLSAFFNRHISAARTLQQVAVEEDADAVYSISEATFAGGLAAKRLEIPSIVHVIGMSIRSPRWSGNLYVRFLDRLTDQFIGCSSAVAEMLDDYGVDDEKVTVVHNGIDVAAIEATAGATSPVAHPGPRVGIVAAYDPRKGHELFVEAAALVARRHRDARFFVVGGILGGQADSVAFERRVAGLIRSHGLEQRFERPGFVPAPEVYAWIRAMDVVVVPSRTEAFAHALLEAMVCGKPIVATGIEGNLDAFVHGHSGLYAAPRPEALADAVAALIEDPEGAATLGRNALARASDYFDLGVTLPAIGHVVRNVLGAASQPRSELTPAAA